MHIIDSRTMSANQEAAEAAEIPVWESREQVPLNYKWRLEDIFEDDNAWEKALASIDAIVSSIEKYKGRVGASAAELAQTLKLDTELDILLSELVAYARMRRDENNSLPKYQDMTERIMSKYYQTAGRTSFLMPEIAAIPEDKLLAYIDSEPELEIYRHRLINQIRQ